MTNREAAARVITTHEAPGDPTVGVYNLRTYFSISQMLVLFNASGAKSSKKKHSKTCTKKMIQKKSQGTTIQYAGAGLWLTSHDMYG